MARSGVWTYGTKKVPRTSPALGPPTGSECAADSGRVQRRDAWFADEPQRVLGAVTRGHDQEKYGVVVLGPDEHGKWRAIDMNSEYPSLDAAALELIKGMEEVSASGRTVFAQED